MQYETMTNSNGDNLGKKWRDSNGVINMVFDPVRKKKQVQQPQQQPLGTTPIKSPIQGAWKSPMLSMKSTNFNDVMSYLVDRANARRQMKYDELYTKRINLKDQLANSYNINAMNNKSSMSIAKLERDMQNKRLNWDKTKFNTTNSYNDKRLTLEDQQKQATLMNDRMKTFLKDPTAIIPQWGDIDNPDVKRKAIEYYAQTGMIPQIIGEDGGWLSDDTFKLADTRPHNYGKPTMMGYNGQNQGMNGYNNTPKIQKGTDGINRYTDNNGNVFKLTPL